MGRQLDVRLINMVRETLGLKDNIIIRKATVHVTIDGPPIMDLQIEVNENYNKKEN